MLLTKEKKFMFHNTVDDYSEFRDTNNSHCLHWGGKGQPDNGSKCTMKIALHQVASLAQYSRCRNPLLEAASIKPKRIICSRQDATEVDDNGNIHMIAALRCPPQCL